MTASRPTAPETLGRRRRGAARAVTPQAGGPGAEVSPRQRVRSASVPAPAGRPVGDELPAVDAPRFSLLGSVRAWRAGRELALGPRQQRLVLAALLAGAGRPVPLTELVDLLWDGEPPASGMNAVHRYVGSLRRVLEPGLPARSPGRWLVRQAGGYLLRVDTDRLDLLSFRDLVGRARARSADGDLPGAVDLYLEALDLWQGHCAEGLGALARVHPAFVLVEHEYAPVVCEAAAAALHCGRAGSVLLHVRRAADRSPLDEALQASLLLVLAAEGKQAEAIMLYHGIRARLLEELGIEPGAELRTAHERVLRGMPTGSAAPARHRATPVPDPPEAPGLLPGVPSDPSSPSADPWIGPAQLPPDIPCFTGRERAMEQALEVAHHTGGGLRVLAVDGIPGVGKTALAVHFAHHVAGDFSDGQLYADLGGFASDGKPAHPGDVLQGFLEALGVDRHRVPVSLEARSALFRSVLAQRRVLVVLDNALDADQVRPLLPGTRQCMVVVTSRARLIGLAAAHGAQLLGLDVLSVDEATSCFLERVGPARAGTDTDADAVEEIVRRCGRLPLALAVVAARAASRPGQPLSSLAAELAAAQGGLRGFDDDDRANDLRGVFSWSYRPLSAEAKRVFRLLPSHRAPDVSMAALATAAGIPHRAAEKVIGELVRARLVEVRGRDRFGAHDLVLAYAAELGCTEETDRGAVPRLAHERDRPSAASGTRLPRADVPGPGAQALPGAAARRHPCV
ncbi:BTAD domain-containing putative transcriptional regulator [Streptomyces carpinensis]|uniref:BTAD domain-containing putative transcriptional regulator n=2 Tax=Streptomyces carpinensis TaxID=66369 RepID=A0ABV1W436_9ACTN